MTRRMCCFSLLSGFHPQSSCKEWAECCRNDSHFEFKPRKAEISQFDIEIGRHQNVFTFQVPMNNAQCMEILDGQRYLTAPNSRLFLTECSIVYNEIE